MSQVKAYAAQAADQPLTPFDIERRSLKTDDVAIEILYCGVCHSDIHQVRNEWQNAMYPMVPGHEIVGRVTAIGDNVSEFTVGELVGVGCLVDSCHACEPCKDGEEQFCQKGSVGTYNAVGYDGAVTHGGYSGSIVTDKQFVLHVSEKLDAKAVAPLLCAGITTYSPLRHWKVGKGTKVAVVGLGGLGHMGVKFAASFGADVTVISTSADKEKDAKALGANHFIVSKDAEQMKAAASTFDFILNTISAQHDYNAYMALLRHNGTMTIVGVPPEPTAIHAFSLIFGRKSLAGSLIGGIKETQEMLDYCAEHGIVSDVEMIDIKDINTAYERMVKNDVRYRFVIDIASLKN